MTPPARLSVLVLVAVAGTAVSCTSTEHAAAPSDKALAAVVPVTPNGDWAPNLQPANFVPGGANPYFPLVPHTTFRYVGGSDDEPEIGVVHVTTGVKTILGINATVVQDRVYLDANGNGIADGALCGTDPGFTAELIEETFDWYATANDNTVWYLGEDSREYDACTLVGTAGSWEAGVNGAQPGIIMLAQPVVGQSYRQEFAEDVAEDWARVLHLDRQLSVPYGAFSGCLKTMDWSALEPGHREHKFYCPNVGLVLEVSARGGRERNELVAKSP